MKNGIIVQARMGSTRLPGKILRPFFKEKVLLDILLDNLHKVSNTKVIVATSDNSNDDALVSYLEKRGELYFRGSENDVLSRFISAAEEFDVDGIVRICSDNPFLDYNGVSKLLEKSEMTDADYIGYMINNKPSIKTHFGFWGEYVKLSALKKAYKETEVGSNAHEHVTIHIYNHPNEFKCDWIQCPDYLQNRTDIRLTIDTQEDMQNAQMVYACLREENENFTLKNVIDYLDKHKEITAIMKKNIINNLK